MASTGMGTFGELLKRHRVASGLSQEGLAERAGLSARAVSDLERGARRSPYRETIRMLAQALGLSDEHHRELEALAGRRRDAALTAGTGEEAGAALPQQAYSRLPVPATPLIGRERELRQVMGMLLEPEVRLVTLTGTGGVGKTRLAIEAAGRVEVRFPDGVCFVGLASIADPTVVPSAIARALGIAEVVGRSPVESVAEHLRDKRTLLVLDNFEHLLDAAAVVAQLLASAPDLTMLTTSRAPLRLSGGH